jgi:hypothetical protein
VLESAAPATPIGWPVPQPAISTGASAALSTTVTSCTTMPGFTMPVPRRPETMMVMTNCIASAGMNQRRNVTPAARVGSSAPTTRMYASARR